MIVYQNSTENRGPTEACLGSLARIIAIVVLCKPSSINTCMRLSSVPSIISRRAVSNGGPLLSVD